MRDSAGFAPDFAHHHSPPQPEGSGTTELSRHVSGETGPGSRPDVSQVPVDGYRLMMSSKVRLIVMAALALAAAAVLKRPVRNPTPEGSWHPADTTPTRR